MPGNLTIRVGSAWVELTSQDTTSATVTNQGGFTVALVGTTGAVPASEDGSIEIRPGDGLINEKLSDLWPGVTGATRIFARCVDNGRCKISVSYA